MEQESTEGRGGGEQNFGFARCAPRAQPPPRAASETKSQFGIELTFEPRRRFLRRLRSASATVRGSAGQEACLLQRKYLGFWSKPPPVSLTRDGGSHACDSEAAARTLNSRLADLPVSPPCKILGARTELRAGGSPEGLPAMGRAERVALRADFAFEADERE
jgi:hypothetical protein